MLVTVSDWRIGRHGGVNKCRHCVKPLSLSMGVVLTSTGDDLVAGAAVPDTNGSALDVDLSAEGAGVLGVLSDFHLLDLLTQGSTVSVKQGHGLVCCWASRKCRSRAPENHPRDIKQALCP